MSARCGTDGAVPAVHAARDPVALGALVKRPIIWSKQSKRMARNTRMVHFFAGMACSAIASPFGIVAAALVPVTLGLAKEMYVHSSRGNANAENFAWVIAGAATFVLCLRILPFRL
jgi:hypothetical protein